MQDKPLDKIINSLGGKKRGRKRKKETKPTPVSEVEFFNAIQNNNTNKGFDQKKIESISETTEVSYEKDFNELKDMIQEVLSKNTTKESKFKKIDPRDIKKLDKYTFKTAVIKTEKGMTQLPALRTGGVVTSPTQALIGENGPEAIVPLEKLRSLYDQMNMSREGFGTMARNLMPNADETQIDSMFRQITNPSPSSDMDSYNPVLAMDLRDRYGPGGVPRPETQESQQEFRARLDKIAPTEPRLLKTPEELEAGRFEKNKENKKDRAEIEVLINQAERFPDRAEEILKTAEKLNPKMYQQMQRDRRSAKLDRRAEERMESVREPGKDLRARREKIFADREREAAEKEKRKKERQKRIADLDRENEESKARFVRERGIDFFERSERRRQESLTINGIGPQGSRIDLEYQVGGLDQNPLIKPARPEDPRNEPYMHPLSDAMDKDRDYLKAARAVVQRHRDEQAPGGIDYRPAPRGKEIQEELIKIEDERLMIRGEEKMKEVSEKIAALQEMREKYQNSNSGREQTSSQNTPRVQPSNPAKVKTPHATGVGGGGGGGNGMGFFDMVGMANKMLPIWRIGNG